MRVEDLDLRELLSFESSGGLIRFAGKRVVLLDAVALGLLRRELIETLGLVAARGVLARFGFSHGWRTAEVLEHGFPWESAREWQRAGGALHRLQGLVNVEPLEEREGVFAEARWRDSYEAEQHRLHFGVAEEAVCWTLTGFASGYLSRVRGREVVCIEEKCVGRGDRHCHLVGRFATDWGEELPESTPSYDRGGLDETLRRVSEELREKEARLARRRERLRAAELELAGDFASVRSPAMKRVLTLAKRVCRVDSTVLITGESGAGKERMARFVHESSPRADGPFVAVNAGALAENLLESELFGHVRGAFTGATRDHKGLFESAAGGTLLLDEIGEVSPAMQVKLLRALQEREVRPVGATRSRPVDVRVLAATNRDLAAEVESGRFRSDLYYRLRVFELPMPALRDRREDIPELARGLLCRIGERLGLGVLRFAPEALDRLCHYNWPGNVRELENAIEYAAVLAEGGRIRAGDLPRELSEPGQALGLGVITSTGTPVTLEELERRAIAATLERQGGHRERSAAELGIGTATLYRKIRKYGLQAP